MSPIEQPNTAKPSPLTLSIENEQVVAKLVDFIVKKKPAGWARRSYASYYKEPYAIWIKAGLDILNDTQKPIVYRYDKWPGVAKTSLYLRINQAIRFLTDSENGLDPEHKYKKLISKIRIERKQEGITIRIHDAWTEVAPGAEELIENRDHPKWKQDMLNWIESGDSNKPFFHKSGLMLDDNEIAQLHAELDGCGLMVSINHREIKLVRTTA